MMHLLFLLLGCAPEEDPADRTFPEGTVPETLPGDDTAPARSVDLSIYPKEDIPGSLRAYRIDSPSTIDTVMSADEPTPKYIAHSTYGPDGWYSAVIYDAPIEGDDVDLSEDGACVYFPWTFIEDMPGQFVFEGFDGVRPAGTTDCDGFPADIPYFLYGTEPE